MQQNLIDYLDKQKKIMHDALDKYIKGLEVPENLKQSMHYSLMAGGKRLRPVLLLASYEAYGETPEKVISTAAALEMIHTYSLIHDDLPAMDDDDFRRGKPTNHKVFNEATAILAGDALLTYSFQIISEDPLLTNAEKVEIIKMLASSSGPKGMVGGQILDMEAETKTVSLEDMERIHALKTGELLRFAIHIGAFLGGATENQLRSLNRFSYYLGLIFQVQDDILDVTGDKEKLGKPTGSDEGNNKSTYPKLLGIEGAIKQKAKYVELAKQALKEAGVSDSLLMQLTDHFSHRDH